jgi:hypothetical protein
MKSALAKTSGQATPRTKNPATQGGKDQCESRPKHGQEDPATKEGKDHPTAKSATAKPRTQPRDQTPTHQTAQPQGAKATKPRSKQAPRTSCPRTTKPANNDQGAQAQRSWPSTTKPVQNEAGPEQRSWSTTTKLARRKPVQNNEAGQERSTHRWFKRSTHRGGGLGGSGPQNKAKLTGQKQRRTSRSEAKRWTLRCGWQKAAAAELRRTEGGGVRRLLWCPWQFCPGRHDLGLRGRA